jgi:hypothetical protein
MRERGMCIMEQNFFKSVNTLTEMDREWVYSTLGEVSDEEVVVCVNNFIDWCETYGAEPYANN